MTLRYTLPAPKLVTAKRPRAEGPLSCESPMDVFTDPNMSLRVGKLRKTWSFSRFFPSGLAPSIGKPLPSTCSGGIGPPSTASVKWLEFINISSEFIYQSPYQQMYELMSYIMDLHEVQAKGFGNKEFCISVSFICMCMQMSMSTCA